jgi:hypothetical protein
MWEHRQIAEARASLPYCTCYHPDELEYDGKPCARCRLDALLEPRRSAAAKAG